MSPAPAKPPFKLLLEFGILFIVLPVVLYVGVTHSVFLVPPALVLITIYALWWLRRDPGFDRSEFFTCQPLRKEIGPILGKFIAGGLGLTLATWYFTPESFMSLPKERPEWWITAMVLYPLISVYPQEIVYRALFLRRYGAIHGNQPIPFILFSAATFSLVHLFYQDWLILVLTFAGGLLFAHTYWRSRSLVCCWLEHSLWGNLLFTLGNLRFFTLDPGDP